MNHPFFLLSLFWIGTAQSAPLPMVERVDAQPLLLLNQRLGEALASLGAPLSTETSNALAALKQEQDDAKITQTMQHLLDPLCVASVEIGSDNALKAAIGSSVEVAEQGWKTFLVKVINHAGAQSHLSVESPNARPIPQGPQEEIAQRWLLLTSHDGRPLDANLSGLALEYRIVQISSTVVGKNTAILEFSTGAGQTARIDLAVRTVPATEIKFSVSDADHSPCMGAFVIRDASDRVYPAQSKRLAPDFFFQTQIYRETGESIRLPQGTYTVICSHGPESIPETKSLTVGTDPMTFHYQVQRWIDTARLGYWSGDHHIHAAGCLHYENPTQGVRPDDMLRHIMGEDVKVGCCLTWGPCFDFQKQFFTGKPDDVSRYPYLLRYDIEVSGFGSHNSGHLNLLKLREQIPPGGESKQHWPTLGLNTLRWAKQQGAVTGPAHSAAGLTRFVGRTEGIDGPHRLPNFDIPAFDGIGANEFIMQVTHEVPGPTGKLERAVDFISTMDTQREGELNIWYHVMNCGIPIVASGETDFPCITGERVGLGRVYVKLGERLDYDQWVEALRRGESYVSDGAAHLPEFKRQEDGSFTLKAAARLKDEPEVEVELIVNGYPIEVRKLKADGTLRELNFATPKLTTSSWVAARIFPNAHTNPIPVLLHDKPIRASKASARWCLASLEQCWKEKQRTYASAEMPQAEADYAHARKIYQTILDESAP